MTPTDELVGRFIGGKWEFVYPPVQRKYRQAIDGAAHEGHEFYATCGTRTYSEQMTLFLQGRKTPGPHAGEEHYPALGLTVTKARPGESLHNLGLAIDSTLDADLSRVGLQPDWNIEHYEPLARNAKAVGLHSLFYEPSFREGPHVELDIAKYALTKNLLRIEFEKRGLRDLRAGLADVWRLLDRCGEW